MKKSFVDADKCEHHGYSPDDVEEIARNISHWAAKADEMGISIRAEKSSFATLRDSCDGTRLAGLNGRFE